jgi:hypothetical protein
MNSLLMWPAFHTASILVIHTCGTWLVVAAFPAGS